MVAKVHIYHSYNDYYLPQRTWTGSLAEAGADLQKKIKNIKILFCTLKCGMKWAQYLSPSDQFYDALKSGQKEIKEMTSPSLLPSSARAFYQFFLSLIRLRHSVQKTPDESLNTHKVQKAAKKVFMDGAKLINKSCKIIHLFDKMHVIEVEKWGKCAPAALDHVSFLTSAIPTIISFKQSYFKDHELNQTDLIAARAQVILGMASTILFGATLYCPIFIPPIMSQGVSTCSTLISITQYFRRRDNDLSSAR
ncbi:MAG TPA: hypothetical protein VLG49_07520 [Rhabdochlamydiaceae bacterium]|nr:hypothetical protein [Rhabdochlamydiaceae bacterium]